MMKAVRSQKGFTLIELLIVLAVIVILTMVAYPTYQDQVRKTRRGEAQSDLMELAGFMERNFTQANRYDKDSAGVAIALPFSNSPRTGTAYYAITIATVAPSAGVSSSFVLTSTAQSTGKQSSDGCGNMTLNQAGVRTKTGGQTGCW